MSALKPLPLNLEAQKVWAEFGRNTGYDEQFRKLETILQHSPLAVSQLNVAAKAGYLQHIKISDTGTYYGTYQSATKTLDLRGTNDVLTQAYTFGHEMQHAMNQGQLERQQERAKQIMHKSAEGTAMSHDYTEGVRKYFRASMENEAKATIEGHDVMLQLAKSGAVNTDRFNQIQASTTGLFSVDGKLLAGLTQKPNGELELTGANVNAAIKYYSFGRGTYTTDYSENAVAVARQIHDAHDNFSNTFYVDRTQLTQARVLKTVALNESILHHPAPLSESALSLTHQFHETNQQPITERTAAMAKAVEANALNAGMVSLSGIYYPAAAEHIMLQGFDGSGKQIEHGVKVGELINAQPLAASVASVSDSPARGGEAGKSASSGVTEKNPILAHAERLYTQTSAAVEKRYTEDKCGLEHGAKNVSMAITAEALAKGMDRIDQVLLINSAKPQDRHFLAIQGREIESGVRINVLEAQQKPVAESLAQIHETVQAQSQSQSQSLNHTQSLNPPESSAKLAQNNTAQTNEESKDPAPERKGRSV